MRELGLCFWSRRADPRGGDELPAVRVLFADPREDLVKQHFEQQLVFDHFGYVKRLTDESMLFDTSEDVSAAVIRVSVDIARMRPDQVARDWLLEMIVNAGPETVGPRVVSDPIEAQIARVLMAMEETRREYVYARMGELISEMFQHPGLRAMVDRLLDDLISVQALHHAVLRIVRHMRMPEFDALRWMKRLVDDVNRERSAELVPRVCQEIYALAMDWQGATIRGSLRRLQAIRSWLPDKNWSYDGALAEPEDDTPDPNAPRLVPLTSAWCPVELMVLFAERSMTAPFSSAVGTNPPDSLFLRMVADPAETAALPFLVEWLFHPCCNAVFQRRLALHLDGLVRAWLLPDALRRHLDNGVEALVYVVYLRWRQTIQEVKKTHSPGSGHQAGRQLFHAMALANWAVVLGAFGEEPLEGGARILARLVDEVAGRIDERQHQRMAAYWLEMEESLLIVVQTLDEAGVHGDKARRSDRKTVREQLRGMRRRVRELRVEMNRRRRAKRRTAA